MRAFSIHPAPLALLAAASLATAGSALAAAEPQLVRQEDAVVALFSLQTGLEVESRMLHRTELRHEELQRERDEAAARVVKLYTELDHLFAQYQAALHGKQGKPGAEPGAKQETPDRDSEQSPEALEAQLQDKEQEVLAAERAEAWARDEGRRMREQVQLQREKISLISQRIDSLRAGLPSHRDSLTGVCLRVVPVGHSGDRTVRARRSVPGEPRRDLDREKAAPASDRFAARTLDGPLWLPLVGRTGHQGHVGELRSGQRTAPHRVLVGPPQAAAQDRPGRRWPGGRLSALMAPSARFLPFRRFELMIAARYLRTHRTQAFITVITTISVMGVAVGVAALIIGLALATGIHQDIQARILGANAHVTVFGAPGEEGIAKYADLQQRVRRVPGVAETSPVVFEKGLMTSDLNTGGTAVFLKGIDPTAEARVTDVARPWPGRCFSTRLSRLHP